MEGLTVYKQMTAGTKECLAVIKREIGIKTTCMPFAVKVIGALQTLNINTEQDALNAATTLLSGLQTLWQGGIIAEDYDKIDFVKRGGVIVPSARVEAFFRAAARKGYRITDTIVAVPKEDRESTYFKENFYNGEIVYTLEDKRLNTDRAVTAQRLADAYFAKFICRLDVHESKSNNRVAMAVCEMTNDEVLQISSVSEQGIFKSRWEKYTNRYGYEKKRKIITNELNSESFWALWTGEMVNKTIIRRALKRVKEILPELKEEIYAFEQDEFVEEAPKSGEIQKPEIPMIEDNVNLNKLTAEQSADCREMLEMFVANPKLAQDKLEEIKELLRKGTKVQTVINAEYPGIVCLKKSPQKWAEIKEYFDE